MTTKEAVEIAKHIVRGINQGHHDLIDVDKKALTHLINLAENYKSELLGKLPKEKFCYEGSDSSWIVALTRGFNDCLSQIKKIIEEIK